MAENPERVKRENDIILRTRGRSTNFGKTGDFGKIAGQLDETRACPPPAGELDL